MSIPPQHTNPIVKLRKITEKEISEYEYTPKDELPRHEYPPLAPRPTPSNRPFATVAPRVIEKPPRPPEPRPRPPIHRPERSVNFPKLELERLQTLLSKYKNVIFSKKTDGVSSKQKESVWSKIECEFNALADTPRTVKQLKYKFENLKRIAKKGASKERQEMRRTGGGPPPPTPPSGVSDATDWLRAIIPSSIDGNIAIYDDDPVRKPKKVILDVGEENMTEESRLPKKPCSDDIVIEIAKDYMTEGACLKNKVELKNEELWRITVQTSSGNCCGKKVISDG